jgi:hypothetical protein
MSELRAEQRLDPIGVRRVNAIGSRTIDGSA